MRQLLEAARQKSRVLELRREELDRVGQPRAREQLLVHSGEDVLRRQVIGESFTNSAEEVRLLDVLLAIEDGGGGHTLEPTPARNRKVVCPVARPAPIARGVRPPPPVSRGPPVRMARVPGLRSSGRTGQAPFCPERP